MSFALAFASATHKIALILIFLGSIAQALFYQFGLHITLFVFVETAKPVLVGTAFFALICVYLHAFRLREVHNILNRRVFPQRLFVKKVHYALKHMPKKHFFSQEFA